MNDDLQYAIFQQLTDAGVSALVKGIYDNPVQVENPSDNSEFPYLTIADAVLSEWDTDDSIGFDVVQLVHTWSRAHNTLECKAIQSAIREALHHAELDTPGYNVVNCECQSSEFIREPDGVTIQGIQTFRIIIEKGQ